MKLPLDVVIAGLIVTCHPCIFAFEVMDNMETTPDEEHDLDKRVFDSIMGYGLDGFVKRKFDNLEHDRGFSGFTDKRLYSIDDLVLMTSMTERPFGSTNYKTFRNFLKPHLVNCRNNERMNWYIQRPINFVDGFSPSKNMEPAIMPHRTGNFGYLNRRNNLKTDSQLNGFVKQADKVVD